MQINIIYKMITKFKIYESIDIGEPELYDYVICDEVVEPILSDWMKCNIGEIIKVDNKRDCKFNVWYENIPNTLKFYFQSRDHDKGFRPMMNREILHWSKDKEDLEALLNLDKYNL